MKSLKVSTEVIDMNWIRRIKQMVRKNEGWMEYSDYKSMVNNRDFLNFLSNTTNESATNLIEKGV